MIGGGNGNPLQYSCLESPMDGGAWWAAVCGVSKNQTWLRDFTFTFHFHALEKEMVTHSSVLAWRIPGMGEPGGLPSRGSHRVRHDWSDLAAVAAEGMETCFPWSDSALTWEAECPERTPGMGTEASFRLWQAALTTGHISGQSRATADLRPPYKGFPHSSVGKSSACNAGDRASIPWSGRSPGKENGNPLQYSCLENLMQRGALWAIVRGIAKSWTWLSD